MNFFFTFDGVLLEMRGCTYVLRGCSRTLKPQILRPWLFVHSSASAISQDAACAIQQLICRPRDS